MKYTTAIFVSMMLAFSMPALATNDHGGGGEGNNTGCNGVGNPNSPCDGGENGGGGDPTGGSYTNTNTNTNTNDNTNTNLQGQAQGQLQGQLQGQAQGQVATGGDATSSATGGSVGDVNVQVGGINLDGSYGNGEGEGAPGGDINSFSPSSTIGDVSNDSSATGGNSFAAGGTSFATGGQGGEGGNATINIGTGEGYGEGEGSGSGVLSSNVGDTTATSSTGDQTTNVTDNSFDAGNTLIIGGGYGQEGEGSGGSTLSPTADSSVNVGDTNNSSNATASTGDITINNNMPEGPTTGQSQVVEGSTTETDVNVDARTINNVAAPKIPVQSVAPSFSSICASGAAGQGRDFGLSLSVTSKVCMDLMMADTYMALGDREEAMKWVEAAARHARWTGGMGYFLHVITFGVL